MVIGMRKKAWTYLKCFLLAVAIEVVALASLLPGLAGIGRLDCSDLPLLVGGEQRKINRHLIYRGVRLLPSLAPPLWWTLPANLAIP